MFLAVDTVNNHEVEDDGAIQRKMEQTGKSKFHYHKWVLGTFPPGPPTLPKPGPPTNGRPGFLAKPEPVMKITLPQCKIEMEDERMIQADPVG